MENRKKVALVTGASKGIGRALVEDLISRKWKVIGVARSEDILDQMLSEFGEDLFTPCVCDVSDEARVKTVTKILLEKDLMPTLFFLNAAITGEVACEDPSNFVAQKHREAFDTNYLGALYWVEAWLPFCQKAGGATFVATSSINAIFAPPTGSAYAASKAAIAKAFEGLSLTYYGSNLNFAVVYPGPVKTDGLKGKLPFTWSPEKMAAYMVTNTLKGKKHMENSLFYAFISRLLNKLPHKWVMKILGAL